MQLIDKLMQQARQLKLEVQVLILAYIHKRTLLIAKILIGLTVGYLLSPIDLIPDFIQVIGYLDDLIIVPLLIILSIKLIPSVVLTEARQSIKDNPKKIKKNNWIFAIIIISIWLALFYMAYRHFSYLWK